MVIMGSRHPCTVKFRVRIPVGPLMKKYETLEEQKQLLKLKREEVRKALNHPDKCVRIAYISGIPVEKIRELGGCGECNEG